MYRLNEEVLHRVKNLFLDYQTLLPQHGLRLFVKDNEIVAVNHILSAISLTKLQYRPSYDIELMHRNFERDFENFLKHAKKSEEYTHMYSGMSYEKTVINKDNKKNSRQYCRIKKNSGSMGNEIATRIQVTILFLHLCISENHKNLKARDKKWKFAWIVLMIRKYR